MKYLIIDDDQVFADTLARAFRRQGSEAKAAYSAHEALNTQEQFLPDRVILDLKIGDDSGLRLLPQLKDQQPEVPVVLLTGYSSIPTAVEAIKSGAIQYLCKPVDLEEILLAFGDSSAQPEMKVPKAPPSVNRLEWEHIQSVLMQNNGNISATARALGMHRRTLQRKLQKRPVKK